MERGLTMVKNTLDWTLEDFREATKELLKNPDFKYDVIEWIPGNKRPRIDLERDLKADAVENYAQAFFRKKILEALAKNKHETRVRKMAFFNELMWALGCGNDEVGVIEVLVKRCYWPIQDAIILYKEPVCKFLKDCQTTHDATWVITNGYEAPSKPGAKVLLHSGDGTYTVGVIQPPIAPELDRTGYSLVKNEESILLERGMLKPPVGIVGKTIRWEDLKLIVGV